METLSIKNVLNTLTVVFLFEGSQFVKHFVSLVSNPLYFLPQTISHEKEEGI